MPSKTTDPKDKELISLMEATKYCNYSQEYLSLRARAKKLKSVKVGRNWMTTAAWLKEYIEKVEQYNAEAVGKGAALRQELPQEPASQPGVPADSPAPVETPAPEAPLPEEEAPIIGPGPEAPIEPPAPQAEQKTAVIMTKKRRVSAKKKAALRSAAKTRRKAPPANLPIEKSPAEGGWNAGNLFDVRFEFLAGLAFVAILAGFVIGEQQVNVFFSDFNNYSGLFNSGLSDIMKSGFQPIDESLRLFLSSVDSAANYLIDGTMFLLNGIIDPIKGGFSSVSSNLKATSIDSQAFYSPFISFCYQTVKSDGKTFGEYFAWIGERISGLAEKIF